MITQASSEVLANNATTASENAVAATKANDSSEEPHIIGEITEKRETNMKHFRMSDGSICAAVYPYEVHYADGNGELSEIDNSLTDEEDGNDNVLSNKKNDTYVKFMKKSNSNKLYTICKEKHQIKVSIEGVAKVSAVTEDTENEKTSDNPYVLQNLSSQITYYDILENTDIQYNLVAKQLKENIIIKNRVDFNSLIYNYHLNGSLETVQQDSKNIIIYEKGSDNIVLNISAPVIWDSAGNYYDELELELLEEKNSKIKIKLSWNIHEDAVYPITIDPVMSFSTDRYNIQDTHIIARYPTTNYDYNNHIRVRNDGYSLLKFPTPTLNSGDKIIKAQLVLAPYGAYDNSLSIYSNANSYNPPLYITAHKILRSWEETTATYQNVNPDNGFYDSTVYSYRIVDGDTSYYTWDITRLANEWTERGVANHGVLLKYDANPSDGSLFDSFFCSTNGAFIGPSAWPQILYQYINTSGIEDYYSYHTQDIGYAGIGYVNDLTGNLTIINPVVRTGGSLMPVTVSLVYNTNSIGGSETPYGRGWKLNWSQKIDRSTQTNLGESITKYVDGDGTEHYFDYDEATGQFIDEINPQRKILSVDSNNYTMVDSSGSSIYFKRNGTQNEWYLWKISDAYGNYIQIDLNASDYNRIDKIFSSTGNEVFFTYNSNNFLVGIKYYDDNSEKNIAIDYNNYVSIENNCIGKVTFPDNSIVQYHYYYYGKPYCISKAVDVSGTSMAYDFNPQAPYRVNCIREYSTQGVIGNDMFVSYDAGGTLFTDPVNNRKYLYTFASNGTLKSVVDVTDNDGSGYGQYYEYNNGNTTATRGTGNMTFLSKTQKSTVNLFRNHSFENDAILPALQAWDETTAISTAGVSTEKSNIGARSYKMTRPTGSNSTRTLIYNVVPVTAGKTYSLSAYVNTAEMISTGKGASVCVILVGIQYESEYVTETIDEWQRISVTFTAPYTGEISACLCMVDATGSTYFDNVQFEEGGISDYNLLENPGFEYDNVLGDGGWIRYSAPLDYTTTQYCAGTRSGRTVGGIQIRYEYLQLVNIPNGKAGDTYVASAFAKASSIPAEGWQFSLLVRFTKNNVDINEQNLLFNFNTTEWQKISGAARAAGDYDTIQFWLLYYNNCNTVYFDNAQLIKDTFGNTYTYDSNGNLISTKDLQDKEEYTFKYDGNNQLIEQTNVSGGKISYTYNTTIKQQLDKVSSGGVTTEYTYDSHGNALTSSTHGSGSASNQTITSSATYNTNGEYMTSMTDSRGNVTQYEYNETRGLLNSVTAPDDTITAYTYNTGEQLTNVTVRGEGAASSATYNYDSGKRLATILSPSGTSYGFTYDTFDRNTAVKIGTRSLSQYIYDSKCRLDSLVYGNGTTISYGYDSLNRQTEISINDTLRYQYLYDGASRIAEVLDLLAGRKVKYEYDIVDRLAREQLINTNTQARIAALDIRYDDVKNRVSGYDINVAGIEKSIDYVYSTSEITPDIITGIKQDGNQILSYGYDGLNRLTTKTISTTTPFTTEYTYHDGASANTTTTLIKTVKNGNNTLEYAYDEVGNIQSISKNGSVVESYTYDALGQLKTVTRGTDVYEYTYDNGGNILSEKKNGTVTKTYTYGDSEWKDLLTTYNDETITYDNIGNPLTYRNGMTFTWADGRKLVSISQNGSALASYTYNADGLRTSKTVNGVETEYYWLNGTLYAQKTGDEFLYFLYDESGVAYGFILKNSSGQSYYYYEFNLQGDIIGIVDEVGTRVVEYTYGAWGDILSITGTLADSIGQKNPLRYRGYYYDAETGFYYVSSRYYDPEIGRFINADGYISTGNGVLEKNMYAYCLNNPVNMFDPSGEIAITTLILIGSIVAGVAVSSYTAYTSHKYTGAVDWGNTILSGLSTFAFCYSYGMSAYGMYASYCNYKGYTPAINVGTTPKTNPAPYSNLQDPNNVAPGKDFTASQKAQIIQQNRINNNGVVKSDLSGQTLVQPQKSMKGVTPPANEWQIDHIIPKSAGGTNSFSNAQVLSREENRIKWDH